LDWRKIPSLSALRAFECAARLGSYSAAARELNVTHAAIAQHVRGLETHLGRPLMHRIGQSMQTTAEGARLAEALASGFSTIAEGVAALEEDAAQRALRVATTPSFAENWLAPRISTFWASHPDIGLEIVPGIQSVDLRRDGFDIALRYGSGGWPGVEHEPLIDARHTIVAAPGVVPGNRIDSLEVLKPFNWLFVKGRSEEHLWLEDIGLHWDDLNTRNLDTANMVLQAVRSGAGLSVHPRAVVENDIATGTLVALFEETGGRKAYHLVRPKGPLSPRARLFIRWLKKQR
jgi:LysR family glycine cleavage system transcriptional activator